MAKAKKPAEPKAEKPEAPPKPAEPEFESARVEITKTPAERFHREVSLAAYKRLVAEHGSDKVKILEVLK